MRTLVIVPVRGQLDVTRAFLEMMRGQEFDDLLVLDNGSVDETVSFVRKWQRRSDTRVHLLLLPGKTISEMWNAGFARARRLSHYYGEFNFLCCNNDITLPVGAVAEMAYRLREADRDVWCVYPDYDAPWMPDARGVGFGTRETHGVLGDGGMFGPCWMLAGERIHWDPLITDLTYQWWFSDNHLASCVEEEGGRQMRIVGLPIQHVNEASARHHDLYAVKLADHGRWLTRHQRGERAIDRR